MKEPPFLTFIKNPIWIIIPISIWLSFELMGSLSSAYMVGLLTFFYSIKPFLIEAILTRIEEYKSANSNLGRKTPDEKEIVDVGANYLGVQILFTAGIFLFFFLFLISGLIHIKEEYGIKIISDEAQRTFQSSYSD